MDENYGVDGNSFVYLSSYKGRDGKIYFGNANGYYAFYPDEFINNFNAPNIVFTGFNLRNRLVEEGDEGLLQGHLSNLNKIYLKHDQNVFSFDLMQIDYAHPEKNKMFCYLENYDNDWRQIKFQSKNSLFQCASWGIHFPGKSSKWVRSLGRETNCNDNNASLVETMVGLCNVWINFYGWCLLHSIV
jgi:hypothetical protein